MLYALAAVPFGVIIYIIGTPPQENNTVNEQERLNTMFLNSTREVATAYFETLDDEKTIQVTNATGKWITVYPDGTTKTSPIANQHFINDHENNPAITIDKLMNYYY